MLKKILSPFFYKKDIEIYTPIWGRKSPVSEQELNQYRADLVGALTDLEELGFTFYMVNSYGNQVLVVKKAPEMKV